MGFLCWGYQRRVHLILLLAVVVLYVANLTITYEFSNKFLLNAWWYLTLSLVFIFVWVTRGRLFFNYCFPWYHYSTLLLELVLQIGTYPAHVYSLVILRNQVNNNSYDYVVYALLVFTTAVYILII